MIIRLGYITACDFLEQTDYLFNGFTSTVGEARLDSDEKVIGYELVKKPTLREYIKSCKESSSPDIIKKLTKNQCDCFLYKCCYYIYPEKRLSEYKNKKGEVVESLDVFSEKCVTLLFQLTGIDFNFLRMSLNCQNKVFLKAQKKCLESLFDAVIKLFEFHDGKRLKKEYFIKFVMLEYIKSRFILLNIDVKYLASEYYAFNVKELVNYVIYTMNAYEQLNKLFVDANYIIGREKVLSSMRNSYDKSLRFLKKTMRLIEHIIRAEKIKDVEKLVSKILEGELRKSEYSECSEIEKEKLKKEFFKSSKKDWKTECIRLLLRNPKLDKCTLFSSIDIRGYYCYNYQDYISSVMFKGNYEEAIAVMHCLCQKIIDYLDYVEVRNLAASFDLISFVQQIHEMYFFLIVKDPGKDESE